MASEETQMGYDFPKAPTVLHFVDHVECKLQSPRQEVISRTKGSMNSTFTEQNEKEDMDQSQTDLESDKFDKQNEPKNHVKEHSESMNSDSGLDSANNSSYSPEDHFIDRQECYTSVEEPDVLTSPNKTVDQLFGFLNSDSSQSLDALNNNNEASGDENDYIGLTVSEDLYLGKEVSLHWNKSGELPSKENKYTTESSMNLYWYAGNVDVDAAELEAFKVSQAEIAMSENATSNLQITVGNVYYQTKNTDAETEPTSRTICKSETSFDVKKELPKTDSWSPAFVSASSRILDLASELKSEPTSKRNKGNESIIGAIDNERHPWGLDGEDRVKTKYVTDKQDDLPEIGDVVNTDNEQNSSGIASEMVEGKESGDSHDDVYAVGLMECRNKTETSSIYPELLTAKKGEDVADAIGYMELKDKPAVEEMDKNGINAEKEPNMSTEDTQNETNKTEQSEDVTDATGYMELNDKSVDIKVNTTEYVGLETSKGIKAKSQPKIMSTEDKQKETIKVEQSEDVVDAIGYMELSNRPVEQLFKASDNTVLETSKQEIGKKTLTGHRPDTTTSRSIESQIIGPEILDGSGKESKQSMDMRNEGVDVSDAKLEQTENIERVRALTVHSQSIVASKELKVKRIPFDPFTIRRKYIIANDSEDKLQNMGGMFLETETLVDEYLDDKNYSLTLNDCWLRLRNKKFEMKVNAAFGVGPNKSPSNQMIANENEIKELLMKRYEKKLEQKRRVSERQLDVLIDALHITEFVTFETHRKRYQMENVIVTMDVTNFGFQVGEIEIVSNTVAEMLTNLSSMETLAVKLGMMQTKFSLQSKTGFLLLRFQITVE